LASQDPSPDSVVIFVVLVIRVDGNSAVVVELLVRLFTRQ